LWISLCLTGLRRSGCGTVYRHGLSGRR